MKIKITFEISPEDVAHVKSLQNDLGCNPNEEPTRDFIKSHLGSVAVDQFEQHIAIAYGEYIRVDWH